jgi:hypothetical protein
MGILMALFVNQFTGARSKVSVESNIKLVYADVTEMRLRAMAENKVYGIAWTLSASNDFQSYEMRSDSNSDSSIIDGGGYTTVRTTTLGDTRPVAPLDTAITSLTFNDKGLAVTTAFTSATFQLSSSCTDCDSSGYAADRSASCDNVNYPEYSCIIVSSTRIKMGKWCDANSNGVFNDGECTIK